MTRALLWLYPATFRREMGDAMLRAVHRRAARMEERGGRWTTAGWHVRLFGSLVTNAIGAWRDAPDLPAGRVGGARLFSWLDFKLGLRMLVRFPGLTLIAGLAMAFAIGLGTGTYQFVTDWFAPTMPFEDGDRVVELWQADLERARRDPRVAHDYLLWKEEMRTVVEIGAFRTFQRNLVAERGGRSTPMIGAAISTTAFEMARTPPLLGRPLLAADEVPGAPEVVLLSHGVWERRFDRDPAVLGRTVRLGADVATVVGVMPEGFGWPRGYRLWTALRLQSTVHAPGGGPPLQVVGKLAPGAALSEARAELATLGARAAAAYPATHASLQPRVERYGGLEVGVGELMIALFRSMNALAFLGLIVLVCGNVALLLFARTAARQNEMVVRGALGASRGRIVSQLFAEALVLGLVSGAVGLVVASVGYGWILRLLRSMAPELVGYWFDGRLDPATIAYALLFTLIAATIAGVLPALKATGAGIQRRLQRVGTSGPGQEFGRLWTAIVVAQIAVTVAFVPILGVVGHATWQMATRPFGMPAEEYLIAELGYPPSSGTISDLGPAIRRVGYSPAFAAAHAEVRRRLELEDDVVAATVAEQVPGAPEHPARILMDGPSAAPTTSGGHYTRTVAVDPGFFDALNVPIVSGRGFTPADDVPGGRVAIVDEVFVRQVMGDRNPVGRHFSFPRGRGPAEAGAGEDAYEIVGVVSRVPRRDGPLDRAAPYVYLPLGATETHPVRLAIHIGPDPTGFSARLRQIVGEVDPELILTEVRTLDDADWRTQQAFQSWFWILLAMGGMGMTLAMAGLYAIVSFTVSRRTQEIGVRLALGADRGHVVWPVLGRALRQIAIGSAIGTVVLWGLIMGSELRFRPEPGQIAGFALYLVAITIVCATACAVPLRRALSIEPTEALRGDG